MADVYGARHIAMRVRASWTLVVAALIGVSVISGCGGEEPTGYSSCIVLDVSGSNAAAREDRPQENHYVRAMSEFVNDVAWDPAGNGNLCFLQAVGNPKEVGQVKRVKIRDGVIPGASYKMNTQTKASANFMRAAYDVLKEPAYSSTSPIIEAIAVAAPQVKPGGRVLVLTDGYQLSPNANFRKIKSDSPEEMSALKTQLENADLLPDLKGVSLEFPLIQYLSTPRKGDPDASLDDEQWAQIRSFWEDVWPRMTGATVSLSHIDRRGDAGSAGKCMYLPDDGMDSDSLNCLYEAIGIEN